MSVIQHNIPAVFDENSRILILGSFPSVKSREGEFFYHHPQNRFWKVLAAVFGDDIPKSIEDKKSFLRKHNIALWDVIKRCELTGSDDSSIRNAEINELDIIFENCNIENIYVNGGKAYELYMKYCLPKYGLNAVKLPSTSPANASFSLEKLIEKWSVIR